MTPLRAVVGPLSLFGLVVGVASLTAQPPGGPPPNVVFGPPGGQEKKLVKQFDKDGDGRLNKDERREAREFVKKDRPAGGRGFGPPPGFGRGNQDPPKPGPKVNPSEVKAHPDAPFYDAGVLRTLFFQFENDDWEAELQDFHNTDVEVPAALVVDGKKYPDVGVHFRGMSSYMGVSAGRKRSLNVEIDHADPKQRLYGYKTLNLLNAHEDPSFLSTVLYSHVARQYIPAPKANLVKVVINGESWGVYTNVQQFNKEFIEENFKTTKGTRWKVPGPGGGALDFPSENVEDYKRRYEIKSGDSAKAWKALVTLCKTINQTPPEKLEEALKPMMDIDGLLWFLALDVALVNGDGYWARSSDYSLYLDEKGKFHVFPHDMNEAFKQSAGFGGAMAFRMPQPGEILPSFTQDMLKLTPEQKKQLAALQKEVDGKVEKLLTEEQRKQLKDMRDRGPGAFAFGGPPGPGGPGGGRGGPGGPVMRGPGGPGGFMGGGGVDLDPLVGLDDVRKPLRSKVLAVPALRAKYLKNIRTIAEQSLDWGKLGPVVANYRTLIEKEVEADTRKLESFEAFKRATSNTPEPKAAEGGGERGRGGMTLRAFAEGRRKFLLDHAEVKKVTP
jgi:spore coat protein CotH